MIKLKITGMTCQHCAVTVKKAIESVEGVEEKAEVYFPQGYAEVEGNFDVNEVIKAVENAGYGASLDKEEKAVYISKGNVYDIVILGGGSAGFAAAIKASDLGAKVLVIENNVIGGTCLNRGCVPTKHLIDVAKTYYTPKSNPFKGIELSQGKIDIKTVIDEKNKLLDELRKEKYWNVLEAYPSIEYKEGKGKFVKNGIIKLNGEEIRYYKAVITTGSRPSIPPIKGLENVEFMTNREILNINYIPEHLVVIGGSAVGLEIGQIFLRFGSKVTILEALPDIAFKEEPEARQVLKNCLKKEGMEILTNVKVKEINKNRNEKSVVIEFNGKEKTIKGTDLLIATGRVPNTQDIGLEVVGVETDKKGFIKTDNFMQTTNPDIYSAGDCVGKMMLVTVAAAEGGIAGENALLGNKRQMDYSAVPHAIFTQPEIAGVGLTETQAKEKGIDIDFRVLTFDKVPRAQAMKKTEGVIKMIVDKNTEKVIGVHICSLEASDIIHKAVLIIKYGLTLGDIINSVDVYPTLSESIKLCAQNFKKDVSKLSCCAS
jgi:mercuric reductase